MYIKEASDFSSSKFFSRPAKRYHIGERYKAIHQKNYLASRLNFQFGTTQNSFIFWLYCCFFISHFHDVFFIADFYRNKNHGIVFISVILCPFVYYVIFFAQRFYSAYVKITSILMLVMPMAHILNPKKN